MTIAHAPKGFMVPQEREAEFISIQALIAHRFLRAHALKRSTSSNFNRDVLLDDLDKRIKEEISALVNTLYPFEAQAKHVDKFSVHTGKTYASIMFELSTGLEGRREIQLLVRFDI